MAGGEGGDLLSHSLRPCCVSLSFSTETYAPLTCMPTKYLGSEEQESYWDLVVLGCCHYIYIQQHRGSSLCTPAFPSPAQTFFHCCPGFFHPIFFLWPYFFFPLHFSVWLVTHTWNHTLNPPRASGLPADLECSGAEGCPVTSCPSTSPLPYSPLIYCKGQVTSARKMDATITFPFSAALSPCLFLMEIVGKKNLLLLSKSYQIFIRVIL